MKVELTVNGKDVTADVEDRTLLVHFLRDTADLTATNIGCDTPRPGRRLHGAARRRVGQRARCSLPRRTAVR